MVTELLGGETHFISQWEKKVSLKLHQPSASLSLQPPNPELVGFSPQPPRTTTNTLSVFISLGDLPMLPFTVHHMWLIFISNGFSLVRVLGGSTHSSLGRWNYKLSQLGRAPLSSCSHPTLQMSCLISEIRGLVLLCPTDFMADRQTPVQGYHSYLK